MKKYGDFCAHAFVKYANNLYTPKILSLKSTTTHYSGNIPGYLQNKQTVSQLHNRELSMNSVETSRFASHFISKSHENGMPLHAVNLELNSFKHMKFVRNR